MLLPFRKFVKLEKRKLEDSLANLKSSLEITNARLKQSEHLSELKKRDCKKLHQRISDLSSK